MSRGVSAREAAALEAEEKGEITYEIISNDDKIETLEQLLCLKCIFAAQLPKMPKEYIVRLVFNKRHETLAIISKSGEIGERRLTGEHPLKDRSAGGALARALGIVGLEGIVPMGGRRLCLATTR